MSDDAIDLQQILDAFGEIDDDARDILRLFVETTEPLLDQLTAMSAARDPVAAEHAAHSVKGAARSAGARTLAAVCEAVEISARAGDWAEVDRRLPSVRPAFAAARAAIERL